MTLLEKAKSSVRRTRAKAQPNEAERLDLLLAYINREITESQADAALGVARARTAFGSWLVTAARKGVLKVEKVAV